MARKKHNPTKSARRTNHTQHNARQRNNINNQPASHLEPAPNASPQRNTHQREDVNNPNPNNGIRNSNAYVVFFTAVALVLIALATCLYLALQPQLSDTGRHLVLSLLFIIEAGGIAIFRRINH